MTKLAERIPAHILYPSLVVLLLSGTVLGQVGLVRAAFSNDGPQIEPDYYARALEVDARAAEARDALELGWRATIVPDRAESGRVRALDVVILDDQNQPITGLLVTVELRRPHRVSTSPPHALAPAELPGHYRVEFEPRDFGLHDVTLRATAPDGRPWSVARREEW